MMDIDIIFEESAAYAAKINSQNYSQLQRKQSAIEIARFYVKEIVRGNLYFKDVPKKFKEEVKEALIRRNREDLIVE